MCNERTRSGLFWQADGNGWLIAERYVWDFEMCLGASGRWRFELGGGRHQLSRIRSWGAGLGKICLCGDGLEGGMEALSPQTAFLFLN